VTTEDRLAQAAAIGDRLADMVRSLAPKEDEEAQAVVESWDLHMADCQRANTIDAPTAPMGNEEHGS
jgi:hypothetical protein